MLKIIHISDLHLNSESLTYDEDNLLKALRQDLEAYVDENTIIVFTGDAVNEGGRNFSDGITPFEEFHKNLIQPLIDKFPNLENKIFIVPGNHDIDRKKIPTFEDKGLKDSLSKDYDNVNRCVYENTFNNKRLENYINFEKKFYSTYLNQVIYNGIENTFKIVVGKNKIGISCINSAWLCKDDNDCKNIAIGKSQLERSLKHLSDEDIRICLFHHPLEFLNDIDKGQVKPLLFANYDFLLTGHTHKLEGMFANDFDGQLYYSIGKALQIQTGDEIKYESGYSIIEYEKNIKIKIILRKYLKTHKIFVSNNEIGNDQGEKIISLKDTDKIRRDISIDEQIYKTIKESHCERVNNDIIVYDPNSKNCLDIEKIFVQPPISNYPENNSVDEKDIKYFSIEDLINASENFVIFATKEAGKTLLLDKILVDTSNNILNKNVIPVLLKFQDLHNKEIFQIVKQFLAISADECREIQKRKNLLIIIDDVDFSNNTLLEKVSRFKEENPSSRFIVTCSQEINTIIPPEYLESEYSIMFYPLFIHSMGYRQIKLFIKQWFGESNLRFKENVEKLVKNFYDFGLPRTPLSVTLFLWIIETQEKRPINNAVLVETFLNNILEKTNFSNVYSETFNFDNKQRLLAYTAKFMLGKGDPKRSYSVYYSDLLEFFRGYLKSRTQQKPKTILDDFVRRGVFINCDNDCIRFKSSFFFHYFLAIYIDKDAEFKQYVFSDDNYLLFTEEIDYLSGLKKDDEFILKFVTNKLENAYQSYNQFMKESNGFIDNMLETKKTISSSLTFELIKRKPTDEEIEKSFDGAFSNSPVKQNIEEKNFHATNKKIHIDKILVLAAKVLKNSEDIDNADLKMQAYELILTSSISYMLIYRTFIISLKEKGMLIGGKHLPNSINFNVFIRLLPLMHQILLLDWVGTPKILPLVEIKIENDKKDLNASDFEKFLSIFIYSDLKGKGNIDKIKNFYNSINKKYLLDMILLKIITYFHLRSPTKEKDKEYLDMLSSIFSKLNTSTPAAKDKFIYGIKRRKLIRPK